MFPRWNRHNSSRERGAENVVTHGMRRCRLPWAGAIGGSRRTLRTGSPRLLCRGAFLRRKILGVRRRDVGAKPRRHRRGNRSGTAMSKERAGRTHAAGSLDGVVIGRRWGGEVGPSLLRQGRDRPPNQICRDGKIRRPLDKEALTPSAKPPHGPLSQFVFDLI